jgi:LacI family transcriptional regulator
MASIEEIARIANVSKMTVSNVINKRYSKVSQKTREKIEKIIKETNYTPNLFARSLKSSESKIVMLAIPQTIENDPYKNKAFNNPFYGEIINSVEYNLRKKGYYLMFRFIGEDESLKKLAINWNIDGVIVVGAVDREMNTIFSDIEIPSVYLDTYVDDPTLDMIIIDDYKGGYLATEHLIKIGKQKIGFVVSMLDNVGVASKRYEGYKDAIKDNGFDFKEERVFQGYTSHEFGKSIGEVIKNNKDDFDALFVYSDIMALSVIQGLKENGLRVPEDIAVIGFDGLYIGELSEPPLTTISQDITKKGELAVELLAKKMNKESLEPEKIVMPVSLIQRKST